MISLESWLRKSLIVTAACFASANLQSAEPAAATGADSFDAYLADFSAGNQVPILEKYLQSRGLKASELASTIESEPFSDNAGQQLNRELDQFLTVAESRLGGSNSIAAQASTLFSDTPDLSTLSGAYTKLLVSHTLYLAHFDAIEKRLRSQGGLPRYITRLSSAREQYLQQTQALHARMQELKEYQSEASGESVGILGGLQLKASLNDLRQELIQLKQLLTPAPQPILRANDLPYQTASLAAKALVKTPSIEASYLSQSQVEPSDEDTATENISNDILLLAEKLNYDPIELYEYVNTNIDTHWYAGAMKGADGVVNQQSGNSVDQATLLIQLFRASNIPARYVSGVVKLPIDKAMNMVGVENPNQALLAFRRAGIAAESIVSGGVISEIEIHHTWVSAYVPYANYRGATVDRSGQEWLPFMPAIKAYQNVGSSSALLDSALSVDELVEQYLTSVQAQDVNRSVQEHIENYLVSIANDEQYQDQLSRHQVAAARSGYLPNTLPLEVSVVTYEGVDLPAGASHTIRFISYENTSATSEVVMDFSVAVSRVINQDITLSYQAASQEDHNLALSFGGLANVPLYLIDFTPQIKLKGIPLVVGNKLIPAGQLHRFDIEIDGPAGKYSVNKVVYSGGYHGLSISHQPNALTASQNAGYEGRGGKLLAQIAQRYDAAWTNSDHELARISGRAIIKPTPSIVFASNSLQLQTVAGQPQRLAWRGVNLDAALRVSDSLPAIASALDEAGFTQLSALQGSYLEHAFFEDYFGVASISADKGLALANQSGATVLVLSPADISNVEVALAAHPDVVIQDVRNWLGLGYRVDIPESPLTYLQWSGSVWRVQDSLTGSAGYFISRGLAGGESADSFPEGLSDALRSPVADNLNRNALQAENIRFLPTSNFQRAEAGEKYEPLLALVTDDEGAPVLGVTVQFQVSSGTGKFSNGESEVEVTTDARGIASATYTAPKVIRDNPILKFLNVKSSDRLPNEVALNYITANISEIGASPADSDGSQFLTLVTIPGPVAKLEHLIDEGEGLNGSVLTSLAHELIATTDKHGNRVSDATVVSEVQPIQHGPDIESFTMHQVLMEGCDVIPRFDSGCGASTVITSSDSFGVARVGIIFGRVHRKGLLDVNQPTPAPATYPIQSTLDGTSASVTLNYFSDSYTIASFGLSDNAATSVNSQYRGTGRFRFYPGTLLADTPDLNPNAPQQRIINNKVELKAGSYIGPAEAIGLEEVTYFNAQLGAQSTFYTPVSTWDVESTNVQTGVTTRNDFVVDSTFKIAGVSITQALPEEIDLGRSTLYAQFGEFSYSSTPSDYQPDTAVMEIFEDGKLVSSNLATPEAEGGLANGSIVVPPIELDAGKRYQTQIVFNKGHPFNEIKSEKISLPVKGAVLRSVSGRKYTSAPVGGGSGGGGKIIIDQANDALCVVRKPTLQIVLFRDATVTVVAQSPNSDSLTTLFEDRELSAGRHVFSTEEDNFRQAFWHEGATKFKVTAVGKTDARTDTDVGIYTFSVTELNSLPVGSPVYENVNLYKGNLFIGRTDLQVPGRGPDIELTRSYSSSNRASSSFGPNWSHNYDSFVQETECGWVSVSGGIAGGVTFFPQGDGSYLAGRGYHSSLVKNDGSWDFYAKDGTRFHYGKVFGFITQADTPRFYLEYIEDTNGNRTTVSYDPSEDDEAYVQSVFDSSGRSIEFEYSPISEITPALPEQTTTGFDDGFEIQASSSIFYEYDRRVITKVKGVGYQIEYNYDSFGRLVSSSNVGANNEQITESYEYGDVFTEVDGVGSTFDLAAATAINRITDYRGIATEYVYEKFELPLTVTSPFIADTVDITKGDYLVTNIKKVGGLQEQSIESKLSYTGKEFVNTPADALVIDPRGVNYLYKMDLYGRPTDIEGPTGTRLMTWANNDTLMLSSQDENGVLSEYQYDEFGNVIKEEISGPSGGSFITTSEYTTKSDGKIRTLLSKRTDRRNNITNYRYDEKGNLTQIEHPSSDACPAACIESIRYHSNGDLAQRVDERGNRTSYRYDAFGNPITTLFPIGKRAAKFDQRSRKVSGTDENGNETTYQFDWLNRLVEQKNAEGGVMTYTYDANSNKLEEVDEEGRLMSYEYDFDNRAISSRTSFGGESIRRTMAYDTNDNLTQSTDYRGNVTRFSYDDANRNVETVLPANGTGKIRVIENQYDNTNNITQQTVFEQGGAVDALQRTRHVYDDLYRKVETTNPENGLMTYRYDGNDNVIQQTDELGRITQIDYDEMNRKVAQRDAVGSAVSRNMSWKYDRDGTLIEYKDARGNVETYTYDPRDRLVFKTNLDENRFFYQYDDYGNVTRETDHFGNEINYQYDELHRRIEVKDQRDFITRYAYDLVGNAVKETWPNGNEIQRTYDFLNRKTDERDSVGALMSYTYDADNNVLSSKDGKGYVTTFEYDALNQVTIAKQPESRTIATEYDVFGNVSQSTDGEGNVTSFAYDKLNRQIRLTDALGEVIMSAYDPVSNQLAATDKRGNLTEWDYDELNRATEIREPQVAGHRNKILNEYDANNNLVRSTDKRSIVTDTVYDRLNRVIEQKRSGITVLKNTYSEIGDLIGIEDANGNATAMEYNQRHEMVTNNRPELAISQYRYDAMGDQVDMRDPEGRESRYEYDLRRRKVAEINGENETTNYAYDLNNNQIEKTRPLGNQWAYDYDELNRLVKITDAENGVSTYAYDRENNLVSQTDANSNVTRYEYDALNRKNLKRYPQVLGKPAAICRYDYDPNNNLKVKTDANGQIDTHSYDALNRLSQTVFSNAVSSVGRDLQSESMQYDGNNNLVSISETYRTNTGSEVRSDTRSYDDFDRLFKRTDSFGKTLTYGYDLNGNRTRLTDSDGKVSSYVYDGLNRVSSVSTTQGGTRYEYDKSSLLSTVRYPNNTQASHRYDQAKRVISIHNTQNNATVSKYDYLYDDNGNRSQQLEVNGGTPEATRYEYDNNDRLTEVAYGIEGCVPNALCTNTASLTSNYAYDAAYNRVSETETTADTIIKDQRYNYNPRNQLTDITDNLDADQSVSYQFDQNGNQVQKTKGAIETNFNFDIRDDIREIKIGGSTVGQFLYDYQGLRIEKLGERGAERSTYDDQSVLQQYDNNNQTRAKFDYGPDRLLSLTETGAPTQFYLNDALQSVVNLTNDEGQVQARYQYDAWGHKRSEVGSSYNRFSFTGYEEDKETGLLYAKARFYDPDTGKFLSEDAWAGDNMIAPSLHRYLYAYQNPTVWVDLDGNAPEDQVTIQENGTPLYSHENPDLSEQRATERAQARDQRNQATKEAEQANAQKESIRTTATAHVDRRKAEGTEKTSQHNSAVAKQNANNPGSQSLSKWKITNDVKLAKESESQVQTETNEQFVKKHLGSGSGQQMYKAVNEKGVVVSETLTAVGESLNPFDPVNAATTVATGGLKVVVSTGIIVRNSKKAMKATSASRMGGKAQFLNRAGQFYPDVPDLRTGKMIPFPTATIRKTPKAKRAPWGSQERGNFIKEWYDRGYETPRGGWAEYDVHHIQPREYGGSNKFWNLAPVQRATHQKDFNSFWRDM